MLSPTTYCNQHRRRKPIMHSILPGHAVGLHGHLRRGIYASEHCWTAGFRKACLRSLLRVLAERTTFSAWAVSSFFLIAFEPVLFGLRNVYYRDNKRITDNGNNKPTT
ncbi:hypothetical protein EXIGLDRAFT_204608 [Exidia glandulosa HHB12029]|uniref:Uncharacterized protein n=1 Tax=Exidia glandulosa HHB12029 TaxID=1314781 RepID=A0A165EN28_EXIGL|nr:hypothetical protein EXIGLDRAFT_204608 [Exidia glandulosa HHB12029]